MHFGYWDARVLTHKKRIPVQGHDNGMALPVRQATSANGRTTASLRQFILMREYEGLETSQLVFAEPKKRSIVEDILILSPRVRSRIVSIVGILAEE
ncbi:hypothetical protein RRH01S_16_00050 [Rhizobium rhizogenes NBRC 13257]|uniref:Uncharacterized protein n=1 Tax=Rhizobium rhizogenes NBRC 13257 TaxID=1220581 RepID=A0AA87U7H5_RHIRH|nr:hypothetical protein RRH01S_16_00050 [Rhizobium rhizogenes NBRC 13257]